LGHVGSVNRFIEWSALNAPEVVVGDVATIGNRGVSRVALSRGSLELWMAKFYFPFFCVGNKFIGIVFKRLEDPVFKGRCFVVLNWFNI
jgi:hypothetical protein